MRDIPAGAASVPASETHAPEKSAVLGGTAPNTSLAIRELTLSPRPGFEQKLSEKRRSYHAGKPTLLYVYARKEPGVPHRSLILFLFGSF
jgi:hypothetical protein